MTAADKQKLKASPFARTRRSVDEEEAINGRSGVKTDKSVGMTGGKMLKEAAKLASATIKGDVHALSMLRADHAVDRKMSAQAWADPNSKTGVEKGMSTLGLVLDRAHELQGPTGWASDDLRRKYRDESERLNAYEAGVQAKKEAEYIENVKRLKWDIDFQFKGLSRNDKIRQASSVEQIKDKINAVERLDESVAGMGNSVKVQKITI